MGGDNMIEFLQVIDGVLFLTITYHIIKLSPLLEMAQFTNMPTLNAYKTLSRKQEILMHKPARRIKVSYTSKFHYAGMTFAH